MVTSKTAYLDSNKIRAKTLSTCIKVFVLQCRYGVILHRPTRTTEKYKPATPGNLLGPQKKENCPRLRSLEQRAHQAKWYRERERETALFPVIPGHGKNYLSPLCKIPPNFQKRKWHGVVSLAKIRIYRESRHTEIFTQCLHLKLGDGSPHCTCALGAGYWSLPGGGRRE